MDVRDSLHWQFDQRGILDDVGKQSFPLTVRRAWIIPELLEVRRHHNQPLADRIIYGELVLLSPTFSLFSHLGQRAQLVVPLGLERVGNLLNLLERAGLAFRSTTSMGQAGGAVAREIRFAPEAIQFVSRFFH
jgi:hypothetical protein